MNFARVDRGAGRFSFSQEEERERNWQMTNIMKEIAEKIKPQNCYYCGKPMDVVCNSHTIPRYCLENISINSEVIGPNAIWGLSRNGHPFSKQIPSIYESGIFHLICRECDSRIFQDYEKSTSYTNNTQLSQKLLSQIAMKNYL